MRRLVVLLAVIIVAIVALGRYAKYTTPYRRGEIDAIFIQYCGIDDFRVAIRDSARIEGIRRRLRLEEDSEFYLCDFCDQIVFVGEGFQDEASINCAQMVLGAKGTKRVSYATPRGLGEILQSYRDSLHYFEPWESPQLKWPAKRAKLKN
ncbi:MAG: hypothetical protein AB7V45_14000 [Candidatus Krumholzibacteriia bacterium]